MKRLTERNRRILVVDDNPTIHADFRRILTASQGPDELDAEAARLFGDAAVAASPATDFELDSAMQGQDALALVTRAGEEGRPYALAFVDMRMPPGWDGLTTIDKLWAVDPDLQVVICTAYSDHSWDEIRKKLPAHERWLVLKKPFDKIEAVQLANALTEKWNLNRMARLQLSTLEELVGLRTEQLQRSIRIKNEFLANVSHELLTPMNGIMGMIEALGETAPTADQADCLTDAKACAADLLRLLQQILAFNQAEAGTLALDPVTLSPKRLVAEVGGAYAGRANHKGIELKIETDCAGPDRFRGPVPVISHVLSALVDNAVKFTPKGSVAIRVSGDPERVLFTVEDTGIGLTDEQIAWISQPFAQVDGRCTRRTGGIGLGLTMARRLAGLLGGELAIAQRAGGGTTATFSVQSSKARADRVAI
jgi:signal transduction histidine kinase